MGELGRSQEAPGSYRRLLILFGRFDSSHMIGIFATQGKWHCNGVFGQWHALMSGEVRRAVESLLVGSTMDVRLWLTSDLRSAGFSTIRMLTGKL